MKHTLEIDPEIRGLLEEIVADPRSALRLAPRRALRSWFDSPEPARTRDVASTSAERHLIEAYREEVAELLLESAALAFFMQPSWHHRRFEHDGRAANPLSEKPTWARKAKNVIESATIQVTGRDLLQLALDGLQPQHGFALARASFSLVPCDGSREFLALNVSWDRPQLALRILQPLVSREGRWQSHALRQRGARLCAMAEFAAAREDYRAAARVSDRPVIDLCYAANLSCFLSDEAQARSFAIQLAEFGSSADSDVREAVRVIKEWLASKSEQERRSACSTARRALDASGPARALEEAYE